VLAAIDRWNGMFCDVASALTTFSIPLVAAAKLCGPSKQLFV
jgi:hypothetical protein